MLHGSPSAASEASAAMLPTSHTGAQARSLERNFTAFSIFFAVNHGCVVAVISLSVVLLGDEGSYMTAALYVTYAATALVASSAIIAKLGTRLALIVGTFVYCIYILCVPLALLAKTAQMQTIVAISGGAIGGVAASFMWAAQGAYFASTTQLYTSMCPGALTHEEASAKFASHFGVLFLGLELLLKMLPLALKEIEDAFTRLNRTSTVVSPPPPAAPPLTPMAAPMSLHVSDLIVAVAYSVCAISAAFGMLSIWDLDLRLATLREQQSETARSISGTECPAARPAFDSGSAPGAASSSASAARPEDALDSGVCAPPSPTPPEARFAPAPTTRGCSTDKLAAAVLLWWRKPHVLLLAPVQVTFGLCAALLVCEATGRLVPMTFPNNTTVATSLLGAIIPLTAALLQVPFKMLSARAGKRSVMLLGILAFGMLASFTLVFDEATLAHPLALALAFVLQGVGRACYEGTNKALYADYFPHDSEAAFANIVLAVGVASAIGYFAFPGLSKNAQAASALVAAVYALFAYLGAEAAHQYEGRAATRAATVVC